MGNKPDFVQVKVERPIQTKELKAQKALKLRVDQNKTVIVYNRINNYILDALLKVVFTDDHA